MTHLTRRDLFKRAGLTAVAPVATLATEFKHTVVTGSFFVTREQSGTARRLFAPSRQQGKTAFQEAYFRYNTTMQNFRRVYSDD